MMMSNRRLTSRLSGSRRKTKKRYLEVFTMKKIITVMLCIVLVLLFAGCGKNGDTSKVEIDYGASSVYSKRRNRFCH